MAHVIQAWEIDDFSRAMSNAISQRANNRFVRWSGNSVNFNGFWRNGDKSNVCMWLDKASWHDAKTGEGGGCKEFAQIAFSMNLKEFMTTFGTNRTESKKTYSEKCNSSIPKQIDFGKVSSVNELWASVIKADHLDTDNADNWLSKKRGFLLPNKVIGSGFANLTKECLSIFGSNHLSFIKQRMNLGPQIIVPIRGVYSDKELNLFFRAISDVSKEDKSRLLTGAGGWSNEDGSPRAFGFPYLINDFPNLVICEGMADYFAAEYLLYGDEKYLPIGASNASALTKWAQWLVEKSYRGRIILIYQLDTNGNGTISTSATGQANAIKAAKILKTANIRVELFKWAQFLTAIPNYRKRPSDIAEVFADIGSQHELLAEIFFELHGESKR